MGKRRDKQPRKRRAKLTDAQKAERKAKLAATKQKKSNDAKNSFVASLTGGGCGKSNDDDSKSEKEGSAIDDMEIETYSVVGEEDEYVDLGLNDEIIATFSEDTTEVSIPVIAANLDIDEDDDVGDDYFPDDEPVDNDDVSGTSKKGPVPTGVQQKYVCFVQRRIQHELSKGFGALDDPWLKNYLVKNKWIIKKKDAPWTAKMLSLPVANQAYYRDVHVWLPDVRWGKNLMPSCPHCKTNKDVHVHGFRSNHHGRLVVGLDENYHMISRRYLCRCCREENKELKNSVETFASQNNVVVNVEEVKLKYTFMGWDMQSLPLFADGRGDLFPAFLTWKAAVDKRLIDLMRPLFDRGLRPERLSKLLVELHTKKHTRLHLNHERELARLRRFNKDAMTDEFSAFNDKELYDGRVPNGKYLGHVIKLHHASIRTHLDNEVKKRGAETLHWDVSYKDAKHLFKYKGMPLFHGLVTALNGVGEVRFQFHVFSDGHDQMATSLKAFEKTRTEYGLPGVHLFFTDDPNRDKNYFPRMLESLRKQQQLFDLQTPAETPSLPEYPYDPKFTKIAPTKFGSSTTTDINNCISAMRATLGQKKIIGLDCEWKVSYGRDGQDKVALVQMCYIDGEGQMRVLLIMVYSLDKLPNLLEKFLLDETITFVGVNVTGDFLKIGRDFSIEDKIKNRVRKNVVNLGKYARQRDVVQNGSVGMDKLCKLILGYSIDKSNEVRFSDWTNKELASDQQKYAAIDAIVSLRLYLELEKKPDLTRRLDEDDVSIGKVVDLVPRNGSVACMATRAATAVIVDMDICESPDGIVPNKARRGKGYVTVKICKIHSPALHLPKYRVEATGERATLADLGESNVVVPLKMLKEHVDSEGIRATEVQIPGIGITKPATAPDAVPNESHTTTQASEDGNKPTQDDDQNEVDDDGDELDAGPRVDDEEIDSYALTSEDINYIRAWVIESEKTQSGRTPLQCDGLNDPPSIDAIVDRFCVVIGDIFHAMDRAKVPVKHEAKKGFFVALREAFFVWDLVMLKELERRMSAGGMTDEQIKNAKYYNSRLFTGCVSRHVPPPTILYWRVRAVYALYGNMIDSATNKPLFNKNAWGKANRVLKDILLGYYSDPPGIEMYNKKLNHDGSVKKNKYGMEMVECMRGTNRTEAYHKNLVMTFGGHHTGLEMSAVLMGERRHRHNHNCSELRRWGFPRIGHYDTWLIDQLQNLVMKNRNTRLYPNWSNTSDYKTTEESFDTIALHDEKLHAAMKEQWGDIDKSDIKLTRDQKYLCKAMGIDLPFLPFARKEERTKFAQCVLSPDFPPKDDAAAVAWCKFVDGVTIFPKLPVHLRTYREKFQRNERVRQSVENAQDGTAKLAELNEALTSPATEMAIGIPMPAPIPDPAPQAMHASPYVVVGGVLIGKNTMSAPAVSRSRGADRIKRRVRTCKSCNTNGGDFSEYCSGRSGRGICAFYDENGTPLFCYRCIKYDGSSKDKCKTWHGGKRQCMYFEVDGTPTNAA